MYECHARYLADVMCDIICHIWTRGPELHQRGEFLLAAPAFNSVFLTAASFISFISSVLKSYLAVLFCVVLCWSVLCCVVLCKLSFRAVKLRILDMFLCAMC